MEYKIGDEVYLKIGIQILPLVISSITITGTIKIYGLDIIFNKGALNEVRENICSATSDMFYRFGVDGIKTVNEPCT